MSIDRSGRGQKTGIFSLTRETESTNRPPIKLAVFFFFADHHQYFQSEGMKKWRQFLLSEAPNNVVRQNEEFY
jgi:hypothetical protein